MNSIIQIKTANEIGEIKNQDVALIYKHSPTCAVCFRAIREVEMFSEQHKNIPVYIVNVISHKNLSQQIAQHFKIRHESPQALLVKEGHVLWHRSHFDINLRALNDAIKEHPGKN